MAHVGQKAALRLIGGFGALPGVDQFFFVALARGDLFCDPYGPCQLPGLIKDRKGPVANPFLFAIRGQNPELRLGCFPSTSGANTRSADSTSSGCTDSTQEVGF